MINASEMNIVEETPKLTGGQDVDAIITVIPASTTQEQTVSMAACNGRVSPFNRLSEISPAITLDSNLVHCR